MITGTPLRIRARKAALRRLLPLTLALLTAVLLSGHVGRAQTAPPAFVIMELGTLGGLNSSAAAINNGGQVVGYADTTAGVAHAFSWTAAGGMIDLGTFGGRSEARWVNDAGQVVGYANGADGRSRAFSWTASGGMIDLGTLGGSTSDAVYVNAVGQVIGQSATPGNAALHGFSWTAAGGLVDLGTFGGTFTTPAQVNDTGRVVGYSALDGDAVFHAFTWTADGGLIDLGTLGGSDSAATAVSASGQIVGYSSTPSGERHAFSWTAAAGMRDLGTLVAGSESFAMAMDGSGRVIGYAGTGLGMHAVMWTETGGLIDLGTLGGSTSLGLAVNRTGQVVGRSTTATGKQHSFSWTSVGGMIDLGTLVDSDAYAQAVNDGGEVVGTNIDAGGVRRALLWQPVVPNQPPIASSQLIAIQEDTAGAVTLAAVDPEGSSLAFTIADGPAHGTLTGTAPNLIYTPAADYNGRDSFTFYASDGALSSNAATVAIDVMPVNDPPVAESQTLIAAAIGGTPVPLIASDADGDGLTFSIVLGPSHGTLSGTPPAITYTPAPNYLGADSFTFTANDGTADSGVASISVNVIAFVLTDLGTLGGSQARAMAINANGQVAGYSDTVQGRSHAFSWTVDGGMIDLGTLGGTSSYGFALNDVNQVVGFSYTANDAASHPFSWTAAGGMVDLGAFGGTFGQAKAVNASGQVVGYAATAGDAAYHAFSWTASGGLIDLGTFGGAISMAQAVNASGAVVGYAQTAAGGYHAFSWTAAGGMRDLGTLGGGGSFANAVNDAGAVTGYAYLAGDTASHAFSWTAAGGMVDLGTLGGSRSEGTAINAGGQIAGSSDIGPGTSKRLFSWTAVGGLIDIGSLGGNFVDARAVNAAGEVVGDSASPADAASRAFAWTPASGMIDLPTGGGLQSAATALNDRGEIAGWIYHWTGIADFHAVRWQPLNAAGTGGGLTPAITWRAPADIFADTPLSAAQLNATANAAGTFSYSPGAGAALPVGSQILSVTFSPTDTTRYTTATATVQINVLPPPPPTVRILSPNGGEKLLAQLPTSIEWTSTHATSFDVELSRDGGATYVPMSGCTSLPATAFSCSWTPAAPDTTTAAIRVTAHGAGGTTVADTSDAPFTISPAVFVLRALGTFGGTRSVANAINANGTVVGWADLAGNTSSHAFSWNPAAGMIDLGSLGGRISEAKAINAGGQVVGYATSAGEGAVLPFSWTPAGGMINIHGLAGTFSEATAVNTGGQAIGFSGSSGASERTFSWTAAGGIVALGTLGGSRSTVKAINDSGQVVGRSLVTGDAATHAFSWTAAGGMVDLGTFGGRSSEALAVNAAGQVVGYASHADEVTFASASAFLWTAGGGMVDLGRLGGSVSIATAINDSGQVVGYADTAAGRSHAFSWTAAGGMIDLGTLGGNSSQAVAVNANGQVVGWSETASGATHAFLWTASGGMVDLGAAGGESIVVAGINDRGEIVGTSRTTDGIQHAVLWQPIDNTPAGTNVASQPADATGVAPVAITFSNVQVAGETTLTISTTGPATPEGFAVGSPAIYYDLHTTAVFSGAATVCVDYSGTSFGGATPRLFHFEAGAWTDVTTSLDAARTLVCGSVTSFSPFAVFKAKSVPVITWPAPASIASGTPLSATQLNATANVPGTLVYSPGIGTVLPQGTQPLSVVFTPADAASYTTATASVSITVTPPPAVMLSASDLSIVEGNSTGATKQAWLTLKLSQKSTAWVAVTYSTSDGSAQKDVDYFTVSDTAWFAPGVVTQQVAIPIVQDTVGEPTEFFFVDFAGVVNGTPVHARSTVTIVNDDSSNQLFTSTADFAAGTLGGGAYLSETTDGELMLAPQLALEFSGGSLGGWTTTPLAPAATATVSAGRLAIDGAALLAPADSAAGQTLEFAATFSDSTDQRVGLGTSTEPGSPMAIFIVKSDHELYMRSVSGSKVLESIVAGIDWRGKPHRYQIVWSAGSAQYYVDGTLMISHTSMAWGAAMMRPVIADPTSDDRALAVDWIRMTPYAASASYTSAVFDAMDTVLWQKLKTTSTLPSGTTATITYRTGDTAAPDQSWTAFTPLGSAGALAGSSRYIQFAIQMTTTSAAKSPVIQDVTVQFKR